MGRKISHEEKRARWEALVMMTAWYGTRKMRKLHNRDCSWGARMTRITWWGSCMMRNSHYKDLSKMRRSNEEELAWYIALILWVARKMRSVNDKNAWRRTCMMRSEHEEHSLSQFLKKEKIVATLISDN